MNINILRESLPMLSASSDMMIADCHCADESNWTAGRLVKAVRLSSI